MALRRSPSSTYAESWSNGVGFRRVATALSESSSIHSDALYHLTRDMSGMGLTPCPTASWNPNLINTSQGLRNHRVYYR
ncbi:hypothetical protein Q5P01_003395 [Channa striata]|uniref:Uncharacterized protein n=1 Tax=Channa striata TaxID=64152 RepID=A0AA88NM07_CHASR|nr:hypothetical protein Q5P01_003395 [Channa striata]